MWATWTKLPLWQRTLAGLALGLIVGLVVEPPAAALKPLGDVFLRAIKLLVVPLVLLTIISGIVAMDQPSRLGRIGVKALTLYVITTVFAISLGLIVAVLIAPGLGLDLVLTPGAAAQSDPPRWAEVLVGLVPDNPIAAMAAALPVYEEEEVLLHADDNITIFFSATQRQHLLPAT
jgi:Na+/H+-dicarboxylate symporter